MKLFCIAGEDSGDLHTAGLIRELRTLDPGLAVRGVGGDQMQAAGTQLIAHVRDINFMGFWEVIRHLGRIRRLFAQVEQAILEWQPEAVLLVDYPGFNLRVLPFLHRHHIPAYYYISPQVWAWKSGRAEILRRYVRRLWVILPFEQAFYAERGMNVSSQGHPLLDIIPAEAKSPAPLIALLPGSRKQEIRLMLPVMLEAARRFPDWRCVVAGAPSQPASFYQQLVREWPANVSLRMNETYALLRESRYAWVASGTATLEAALWGTPQVVVYKGSPLSYAIGKRLVKVPFISLVNLILGRAAVEELIQDQCNAIRLTEAMQALMAPGREAEVQAAYAELRQRLGGPGASRRVAAELFQHLTQAPAI
jgi:lipid-A-disaccharide synthase